MLFCEEEVYEGEDYYVINGYYCCEDCALISTSNLQPNCQIMIRSVPRPVDETGALSNRKKYRAVRSAPSEQRDNISGRKIRKKIITLKEAGGLLTEIGLSGAANKIMKIISESIETNDKKIETPAESLNAGGKNKNSADS